VSRRSLCRFWRQRLTRKCVADRLTRPAAITTHELLRRARELELLARPQTVGACHSTRVTERTKHLPNLAATALARDKHQMQSQTQLGAVLNAIVSGKTGLIGLELFQSSVEGKSAVSKISDSAHFLADLHFRLSQSRRTFIVPSLNFLGKTLSVAPPLTIACCNNFAEDINAVQTIERAARKMSKKPPQPLSQQAW